MYILQCVLLLGRAELCTLFGMVLRFNLADIREQIGTHVDPPNLDRMVRNPTCMDNDAACVAWQRAGECERNPDFMHLTCRMSCGICLTLIEVCADCQLEQSTCS
jgi:hypothetical protein